MLSLAKTLRSSLPGLLFLLASCATVQVRNISHPGEFARNLFRIAEEGTAAEWGTQLTAARRELGEPYVDRHYTFWQKNLLELKPAFGVPLEQVNFRLTEENGLEFESEGKWHLLIRVAREDGGLKINQD